MIFTLSNMVLFTLLAFLLPLFVSAVPQNTTVDDSDQARIDYRAEINWSHDPLLGYEQFFVNRTRSYTYLPGASALFNFTGTGIYLQGPYSNDQAKRSVTLDGQDMGTFTAYATQRLPIPGTSAVFWGKGGLEDTLHTVVVTHADTAAKILVMDAWIFEADSSQLSSTDTSTAGAADASNIAQSSSPSMISTIGIILGAAIPLALLLLCVAGFWLLRKRRQRNHQRHLNAIKEKMFPSSRHRMRFNESTYPASTKSGSTPSHRRSASATSAPEYSVGKSSAEFADSVSRGRTLLSRPFHHRPRAFSETYNTEDGLGLSNHPLFLPTPSIASVSSESHYPTPPPYAGAPTLFFERRPDPVPSINSDYTPRPIVRTPTPPSSLFRQLSSTISGVIPAFPDRAPSRGSVLTDFRYNTTTSPGTNNNLDVDVERAASPSWRDRDAYLSLRSPYIPSTPNRLSPISPISTGFARQSADLGELGDFKYDATTLGMVDALGRLAGAATPGGDSKKGGHGGGKVDPFDDE